MTLLVNIIHIRLSPWAPGCIDRPWTDPALRLDVYATPLVKVVAALLRRLGRGAGEISLDERVEGEIEFLADVPRDLAPYQDGPGILALLWGGPSLVQVRAALERIAASGWKPGPWSPPPSAAWVLDLPSNTQGAAR